MMRKLFQLFASSSAAQSQLTIRGSQFAVHISHPLPLTSHLLHLVNSQLSTLNSHLLHLVNSQLSTK